MRPERSDAVNNTLELTESDPASAPLDPELVATQIFHQDVNRSLRRRSVLNVGSFFILVLASICALYWLSILNFPPLLTCGLAIMSFCGFIFVLSQTTDLEPMDTKRRTQLFSHINTLGTYQDRLRAFNSCSALVADKVWEKDRRAIIDLLHTVGPEDSSTLIGIPLNPLYEVLVLQHDDFALAEAVVVCLERLGDEHAIPIVKALIKRLSSPDYLLHDYYQELSDRKALERKLMNFIPGTTVYLPLRPPDYGSPVLHERLVDSAVHCLSVLEQSTLR